MPITYQGDPYSMQIHNHKVAHREGQRATVAQSLYGATHPNKCRKLFRKLGEDGQSSPHWNY